jgi:hypothetical protein
MKTKIIAAMTIIFTAIWLTSFASVYGAVPEEPHNANAMWVEPSLINVTDSSIGDKFNVTVWLNVTVDCGCWQFKMLYNKNQLKIVSVTLTGTGGGKSDFFEKSGSTTFPAPPDFGSYDETRNFTLVGESWLMGPFGTGVGSLSYVEFEIIAEPPFTGMLDISTLYPPDTYIRDPDFEKTPLNIGDTTIIPEFHSELLVIFVSLSLIAAFLSAKKKK